MNTTGRSNDAVIMFVPLGVVLLAGIALYDGPMEALSEINNMIGEILSAVAAYISSLV